MLKSQVPEFVNQDLTPWISYMESMVPALLPFHKSTSAIRLLLGGNGVGKTTSGSWEAACFSTGYNPIRDETYPTPNEGWAVCLRLKDQGPVLRDALARMLPMRMHRGHIRPGWKYYKQADVFELLPGVPGEGSIIRLKQQEDGSEAFFGARPLWIWPDEEKKGQVGERNFNQMMARRTPGQKLHIFCTMTPENGFSWTYRRMYDKDPENHELIPGVAVFEVTKDDCLIENGGFIDGAELEAEYEQWPEYEREARRYGRFNPMGTHPFYLAKLLLRKLETAPRGKSCIFTGERTYEEDQDRVGTIYRERESGHEYLGVWDPSSGTGGDFSDFVVLDRNNLAEVYHSSSNRMDPDLYALRYVLPAIKYYNQGTLAVEINGESGGAALGAVRGYENLYYQKIWDKATAQSTDRLGWRTTDSRDGGGSRSRIFDALTQALREDKWDPSYQLLQQMGVIVRVKTEKGWHAEHPDGKHDDHVVAMGIAMAIHYEEPIYDWPPMARLQVRYQPREESALVP